jgi:triphosphoribosyl-dephospho-CoA synthetase
MKMWVKSDREYRFPCAVPLTLRAMLPLLLVFVLAGSPVLLGRESETEKADPSLAELARRERERRAQGGDDVRLIRNEDIRGLRGARVTTSVTRRQPTRTPAGLEEHVDVGEEREGPEGEEVDLRFWAAAFQEARTNLHNAANRRMVLELRMNNLRNAFLQQPDGTTRERIEAEMAAVFQEVEQGREDEKAARQAIRDLENQATRAGLNPGQIRDLIGELPESSSIVEGVPQALENDF